MKINIVLLSFIIILGLLLSSHDCKKNRIIYITLCCIVLLFVAAFRNPEFFTEKYGIDTLNYERMFKMYQDMEWNEIWISAYNRYWLSVSEWDVGYIIMNKLVGLFTNQFPIFSLIADLVFFIPLSILFYRYCTKISQLIFGFVFYVALIQIFLFSGARQMFALGFDLMALLAIKDRKKVLAVTFLLFGISIHFSSLLFFLPLLMVWVDVKPDILKILHFVSFILLPLISMFPDQIIVFLGESVGIEKYAEYGRGTIQGGASTFIVLLETLSVFCFLTISKKTMLQDSSVKLFYSMAPLLTLFAPLVNANGSMIRVSLYFHVFLIFLVPFAIDTISNRSSRMAAYIIFIGIMSLLTVSDGGMRYLFYWQYY